MKIPVSDVYFVKFVTYHFPENHYVKKRNETSTIKYILIDFITNPHLKVGNKELPIKQFGTFNRDGDILKINEKRYGKSY